MLLITNNIDLLTVAIAVAGTFLLGFIVFFSNQKSATNKNFFYFSLVTGIWGSVNYLSYNLNSENLTLWSLRFVLFFAVWQSFFLYKFLKSYPNENKKSGRVDLVVGISALITSLLTLTPYMFKNLNNFETSGVPEAVIGPAMLIFGLFNVSVILFGVLILIRNMFRKEKKNNRQSYRFLLMGISITFFLIILFNFFLPVYFQNRNFIPLGAIFLLPFIVIVTYATARLRLFNTKALATGIFIFLILILLVLDVVFTDNSNFYFLLFNIVKFIAILGLSILLLRSVVREVHQREQIEQLAQNLKKANERLKELDRLKSEFVSIASHQLRSPLTAMKGYASLILEGSFGKVNDSVREAVQKIFDSSNLMAVSVQDFLDVSRIEQGRMKYNMEVFDLTKLLQTVVEEQTPIAKEKGLDLTLRIPENETFKVNGDLGKIKQVLTNLIDNSIKYTPKGSVNVVMCKVDGKIDIEIRDTGVGISKETLAKLFDKFVRSRNAHHVNVSGTGLGLFVVKEMMKAHGGTVWATSEGEGKGSVFHVEINEYGEN